MHGRLPAVVAVVAMGLWACGDGGPPSATSTTSTSAAVSSRQAAAVVDGLCRARSSAGTDLSSARGAFYDRSHDGLHTIARALDPVDRPLSARLLEAKGAVEAGLAAGPPEPTLAADLDRLLDVTRAGLARLSVAAPPCP